MTPVGRAVVAFVLVAGAGPAGFLIYHMVFNSHPLRIRPSSAPVSSAPLSSAPGPRAVTRLTLPEAVALPDSNGRMHRLAEYRGHPLMLNFWATWCEPCRREIPLLEAIQHENTGKRIEIVGIAVDHPDSVQKMVKDLKIGYPVLVGEKGGLAAVSAFGMDTVLPFTVFADPQGRIVTLKVGELHRDEATFILARLADLAAGRLDLEAARGRIDGEIRRLAIVRAGSAGSTSK